MKIGFDAKRAFHNFRGLGNFSRTLLEGLYHHYPENDYYLYTPPFKDPRALNWAKKMGGEQVHIVTPQDTLSKALPALWRSINLGKVASENKLDIYHGLSHELPVSTDSLTCKKVVTIHDLIFMRYPQFFPWVDRQVYRAKYLHSCQKADKVVAICQQTKRDIVELLHIDESKVEVIYQSCHPLFYEKLREGEKQIVLSKYNLKQPFILNVAAIVENKNGLTLLEAFDQIKNETECSLVFVGNGKGYKKKLQQQIIKKGLQERVYILEGVDGKDLPAIYQSAKVFAFPSFYEGFGLPIVEAMASSVPVVTSTGSCFPEAGGEAATYIDPTSSEDLARAMKELLGSQVKREEMIQKGLNYVQRFSWDKTSQELMNLYSRLTT